MKKIYEKPSFFAEEYRVASSIAACGASSKDEIAMEYGKNYCDNGSQCKGHTFSQKHANKSTKECYDIFTEHDSFAYLFTSSNTTCEFTWDSKDANVMPMDLSFSEAFYGNGSSNGGHQPGHDGAAFFS